MEMNKRAQMVGWLVVALISLFSSEIATGKSATPKSDYQITVDERGKIIRALPSVNMELGCSKVGITRVSIEMPQNDPQNRIEMIAGAISKTKPTPEFVRKICPDHEGYGYALFFVKSAVAGAEYHNKIELPFGPHTKIITINSNGNELLPRPPLNEEDDIYIAIVNLDNEALKYSYSAPVYTAKPFDQILNNIFGLSKEELLRVERGDSKIAVPPIEYSTLVFYLGNFHGQANMQGGLNVNYQIERCKKGNEPKNCENFVKNGVSLADSNTAEKKPEIHTSATLKVHNLYRFKATGGMAMATFDQRKFKDANTFDPVIGLSCFLFDEKNASQSYAKWYDRISLWGGISLDDPLMQNIFVGPAYEIVDGLDISAGYNHQNLTRKHGGGEDHKNFIGSAYVALNVDLNIFQTFQKIANGMKPADAPATKN